MDDEEQVRALLRRTADEVGEISLPLAASLERRQRHRRHLAVALLAPACVMLAVIGLAVALHRRGDRPGVAASPTPSAGATALATYRWRPMPDPPIAVRTGPAAVWTGSQLLLWGGSDRHDRFYADGAAYDPTTRRWTTLPSTPLSARTQASAVWTGSGLFIWGGIDSSLTPLTDGAMYDPATRTWTTLPPAPVSRYGWAHAYLVDSRIIVLSTSTAQTQHSIAAASFDPAKSSWTRLPSVRLLKDHDGLQVTGLAAGHRLFVWSQWSHSVPETGNSVRSTSAIDGYTLDVTSRAWSPNGLSPELGRSIGQPQWTGSDVLFPAQDIWCGMCSHPFQLGRTGTSLDPDTGERTVIAHGPVDDLNATYVWTGSALLGVDTTAEMSGGGVHHVPGEAAAWNPTTRTWTSLPRAPYASDDGVVMWAGSGVIVWGPMHTASGKAVSRSGIELTR